MAGLNKYQAYPEYKDSGVEWLGEIPSHWNIKRLGQFFEERREKVSDKDFPPLSVTMQGIVPQIDTAAKTDAGDNRKLVLKNDFVINSRSDRKGSAGVSQLIGSVSLISIVMEPKNINPKFAHHLLRSYPFQEEFYRYGKGIVADLWSTNSSEMKNILIPELPKDESDAIASFLDHETAKIDNLIEKQQKLIELLKEKRQAVISHAVTKGLNPDVPMKDSGVEWLEEVPEHWIIRRLKHTASLQSGMPKGKDLAGKKIISVPMLRVANVQDGYLDLDDVHNIDVEKNQLERYLLRVGDVLMNEGGDNDKLGRGAIWAAPINNCIHQNHVFAIRPKAIESEWLDMLTRAAYAKFHFYRVAKQSTNLASISSTNIKETPLLIPPKKERDEILKFVNFQLDKLKATEEQSVKQVALLQERRTALISAAVTGKIDVRNWVAPDSQEIEESQETAA
ncbi:restriction endonuclease subunit S [Xenorhabdus bovienii]|uniref:restriction endonuclease subunit S n=1 Tax=Xenorhabdus bovienii TaxID=40576 RepID=UPI0023B290F4|nr:restriction endonuclease subunit S [Xenorhabdus bovienii]MDE9535886.1 restriction endonuclease subunit S [Xenorhabdus bovienii]MDE9551857.1 restriction endonuclease subunit S [Xenorhabdus bovienii]MDE9555606.1 restriction endonuclease subunit S [Xenorhabdus bovienii]MDE9588779.1 restriction endonuclease subunit S [Xenorhabdus bovienii]